MLVVGPFNPSSPAEAVAILRHYHALIDGQAAPPLPVRQVELGLSSGLGELDRRRRPFRSFVWTDEAVVSPATAGGGSTPATAAPIYSGTGPTPTPPAPTAQPGTAISQAAESTAHQYAMTVTSPPPPAMNYRLTVAHQELYWALAFGSDDFTLWALTECGNDTSPALLGIKRT